jgi:glycine dehydrogenase subunit 1
VPFVPHTAEDVAGMLATIGVADIAALFDEIPAELPAARLDAVPEGLSEMLVTRLASERAEGDGRLANFIGAGAYEHHIPAAVWQIVTRGEFYTAYTPYQAEASQGTLQLLYEFQSMMTALTGLEVSNASLYDGASALAEAVLMAVRANKRPNRRVLVPAALHPAWRRTVTSIVGTQGIEIVEVPYCTGGGDTPAEALAARAAPGVDALVIAQPNFFGVLEDVDALTDWAHAHGALAIAACNPLALALLKPPGAWGTRGADICCGEAQPLGIPLAGGGPYLGFLTARQALVRQMPGRIIGRTVDIDGRPGYTLTLQAREQHIRRSKATSNICTNQGLMVTAATIHMAILGAQGLAEVAAACHANTRRLQALASALPGVAAAFEPPFFHETVLLLPQPADQVLRRLRERGILGGFDLRADYPELGDALLVCATETKTEADLQRYAQALGEALAA